MSVGLEGFLQPQAPPPWCFFFFLFFFKSRFKTVLHWFYVSEPGSSSIFYSVCALVPERQLQVLICLLHPVSLLRLDPILYKKCQSDASRLCHTHGWNETSELMPPGAIFSCLYRHAYRSLEQGRRVSLCRWFNLMIKCEGYSTWRSPSAVLDLLIEQFVSGEVTVKHKNLAYRAFMQP